MKSLIPCLTATLLASCVSVQSVSISPIPPAEARKKLIKSSASNAIVFFIPFANSFIENAREDLEQQCPKGSIQGVLTKHQTTDYFLGLVYTKNIMMQGYCLASNDGGGPAHTNEAGAANGTSKGPSPTKVKANGASKKKG